jgi:hypothetical protein
MKRDEIAAFVADVLDEMKDAGVPVPSRVVLLKLKDKTTTAYYDDATDELVVNENGAFWKGNDQQAKQEEQFRVGRLSTPDPRHPILHEIGHAASRTRDPRSYRTLKLSRFPSEARLDLGEGQVSLYAMTSPHEFVAEVFAGLVVGMVYSESVMNWYETWIGWPL